MNLLKKTLCAGVAGLLLSGAAWADAEHHQALSAAQIEMAKTPTDHEAIAQAYEAEAAAASAKAAEHEGMAKVYKGGGSAKVSKASIMNHCERLIAQYRGIADESLKLAAAHRQMAKDCCKKN